MKTLLAVLLLSGMALAQSISNGSSSGASTNPTTGTIPVKSGASTFGDTPITVSPATTSGAVAVLPAAAVVPFTVQLASGDSTSHSINSKDSLGNVRFYVGGADGSVHILKASGADADLLISGGSAASTATSGTGAIGFNVGSETIPKLHWGGGGIDYGILLSSSSALVNVPATLNWAQTTDSQDSIAFGEATAATGGTITNGLSNQTVLAIKSLLASTAAPLSVVQGSISGTVAFPAAQFQTTWNNSGLTGMGFIFNVTDTSSAAGSLIFDWRKASTSQLKLDKSGNLTALGTLATTGSGAAGGHQMTAGTANGHATASTVTIEAPAAVTAYEIVLPGAAASGIARLANSSSVDTVSISELSGDCATSGSNAVVCTQINGSNFAVNSSGLPTKVDGITTAGQGVDIVQCITSAKVETAADASVLSCTPASVVGGYEVCVAIDVSAANTATLGWTATWTNTKTNANAPTNLSLFQMGVAAPALTFTAAANNSYYACVPIGVSAAGTAIVVKTTFSGTSIAYNVSAWIKRAI